MRVLITGASGFIGSHVARTLVRDHEVIALVRPGSSVRRLRDISERIVIRRGCLTDGARVTEILREHKPDACMHLAWYAEPGKYLDSFENVTALSTSFSLLDALDTVGCKHIVAVGTCAEYDTDRGFLREDSPARPTTLYAAAKLSLCLMGEQMARKRGATFAWARLFYPYGPDEDNRRAIPSLIRALHAGAEFPATAGEQVRDYIHVEDVASAFVALLNQRADGVFNISSGSPVTMRFLMSHIGELIGRSELIRFGALPYRHWEPMFICGSNERLKSLGWRPAYSLAAGLRQTYEWWLRQDSKMTGEVLAEHQ